MNKCELRDKKLKLTGDIFKKQLLIDKHQRTLDMHGFSLNADYWLKRYQREHRNLKFEMNKIVFYLKSEKE